MKSVEKSARTVEEAVQEALRDLGVDRDQVEVEVLEEGNRGIFGLIGGKLARVLVTVKDERQERLNAALEFLKGLLERLNCKATVNQRDNEEGTVVFELTGDSLGLLIGRRGQMLDAMQYLVNAVANKGKGEWVRIILDAAGYRAKRAEALQQLAQRVAERVKRQDRRIALEPMNALERRIVHMALADDNEVQTQSEGEDPHRRVVVLPRRG